MLRRSLPAWTFSLLAALSSGCLPASPPSTASSTASEPLNSSGDLNSPPDLNSTGASEEAGDREDTADTSGERESLRQKRGGPWSACYADFEPGDDTVGDLERLTTACGPPLGLVAVTPIHGGALQGEGDRSERFAFRARAGRCYRFFSVSTPEVRDLDLAVTAPDGRLAAGDASDDRFPVVPPRGPLCVEEDGVYGVEVAVVRGRGSFVVQIWGD
ncbi:hypothetical protein [Chondromyces apiculatus]|uniref:hypothetical protein n=1 Tax=Chondromyces apiculatus TaxID=51 RepID=UPI0005C633F9|nr:hypothetical protein [Chondromyces apiculatus]